MKTLTIIATLLLSLAAAAQTVTKPTAPTAQPKPIVVSDKDALAVRTMQVQVLSLQNQYTRLTQQVQDAQQELQKRVQELYEKYKVSPNDYTLSDSNPLQQLTLEPKTQAEGKK